MSRLVRNTKGDPGCMCRLPWAEPDDYCEPDYSGPCVCPCHGTAGGLHSAQAVADVRAAAQYEDE